ncbi:MAG: vanadium-dependent haloperoxidase [Phycisphaerales bacterium]|nr:vanadium-dependent haloperoxidase [Phycisphaerales bacterium]
MADAAIACWNAKYTYEFWRPVTAIQLGDDDENPCTFGDPTWLPLITTPPFPTYTSGHSTFSGAAANVLAQFFDNDDIAFDSTSDGLPGVTRSFTSFSQAAGEAADSRLYGGIHFRFDNEAGLLVGTDLGYYDYRNYLRRMGDMDCDGNLIAADIDAFVMALEDEVGYQTCFPACNRELADMNHDGRVNNFDINPFVDALMSGG